MADFTIGAPIAYITGLKVLANAGCPDGLIYPPCFQPEPEDACVHFAVESPPESFWWLPTGVTRAHCIGGYIPKGAASLPESYENVAHPGTFGLTTTLWNLAGDAQIDGTPGWNATDGWVMDQVAAQGLDTHISSVQIGRGTGSVVMFYKDAVLTPGKITPFFEGQYIDEGDLGYNTKTMAFYNRIGISDTFRLLNGRYWNEISDSTPDGMVAVAGHYGYVNGVYVGPDINGTYDPIDIPSIVIGNGHAVNAVDGVPYKEYGAGSSPTETGFIGKVPAFFLYDVVLTQAQLDELRANAQAQGIIP